MRTASLLLAALLLASAGCSSSQENESHGKPHGGPVTALRTHAGSYPIRAVCTTGMVADLVRNIGGERVAITQLMGEGTDPHQYKASPGDVSALSGADV